MFAKLFRPKWRHSSPQVRASAVVKLRTDRPAHCTILRELALADSSAEVRKAALARIDDPELLLRVLEQESDPQLLLSAAQGIAHWLSKQDDLERAQQWLQRLANNDIRAQLILSDLPCAFKQLLLTQIDSPQTLLQLAIDAPTAALRRDSAERLSTPEQLEQLLKESRGRDKAVHRLARERLGALREAEQQQLRIDESRQQLLEHLQQLVDGEDRQHFQLRTDLIVRDWQALPPAPAELGARFEQLRLRAGAIIAELDARQAEQAAAQQAAQRHQQACAQLEGQLLALISAQDEELEENAAQLEQLLADTQVLESGAALPATLKTVRQSALLLQQALARLLQHRDQLAERLNDNQATVAVLRQLLERIDWPHQFTTPALLLQAQQHVRQLQDALQRQHAANDAQIQRLESALYSLSQSIEQGELRLAGQQLEQAQEQLQQLANAPAELEHRLRSLAARLQEMRDWQGFAVNGKKEALCKQMEALVDSQTEPRLLADQIRALQQEWKQLDATSTVHSQRLWQRFHAAGEAAYAPCEAHFDSQRQQREHNLSQREEICRQLSQYLDTIDWESVDWPAAEQICHTAKREWKQFSPVDRSPGKAVQQRFNQLIRTLDQQVRDWHLRCEQQKQQLIAEAAELASSEDVRAAADAAKSLQQQWRTIGPAFRTHERHLWQQFRSHCDKIFERLKAEPAQGSSHTIEPVAAEPLLSATQQSAFDACITLLDKAEAALMEGDPDLLPALLDAVGNALRKVAQPWREQLQQRLEYLGQLREQPDVLETQLRQSERQLRELCIRLEILLNRPSPEEDQVQRMEYQMLRLQQALAEHNRHATQADLQALVLEWQTVSWNGVFPQLQQRFERLLQLTRR